LLAREHRIEWRDPDVDPEWCALRAGVTTTIRIRVDQDDPDAVRQKYEGLGAAVVELDRTVLYVARASSDAEQARELERRLLSDGASMAERQVLAEELGWALGHPTCCVEAHVKRVYPTSATLIVSYLAGNVGTDAYRAARDAWVARPSPRLNPFLRGMRRSLITFEPCRYDCAHALGYADRIADACALANRQWLGETDLGLARPIVIAPNGARAIVGLERRIEPMRIVHAEPLSTAESDSALADRLLGAEARDDGLLSRSGLGWCLLVDFGWRGERQTGL
jgi:hypothetical protein